MRYRKSLGRRPDGFTFPKRISARAVPPSIPLNQLHTRVCTLEIQGISTGEPENITIIMSGTTSKSSSISLSCAYRASYSDGHVLPDPENGSDRLRKSLCRSHLCCLFHCFRTIFVLFLQNFRRDTAICSSETTAFSRLSASWFPYSYGQNCRHSNLVRNPPSHFRQEAF